MPNARIDWNRSPAHATGFGNYTRLHYHDGTHVLIAYTLRVVLERFTGLVRVHKACAVDPGYVKRFRHDKIDRTMSIELADGTTVDVARRRIEQVKRILNEHHEHQA